MGGAGGLTGRQIEEVKCVEQVLGEEEEVSNKEFARFEEKLKKAKEERAAEKGEAAPAS